MNLALEHRGPDGHGQTVHENVGLAHRRLAIIDPATGAQPILNDDASVALTFNGEVYNYVELRSGAREGSFEFTHDSRIPRSFCEPTRCLGHRLRAAGFRGMFAFAIHDRPCERCAVHRAGSGGDQAGLLLRETQAAGMLGCCSRQRLQALILQSEGFDAARDRSRPRLSELLPLPVHPFAADSDLSRRCTSCVPGHLAQAWISQSGKRSRSTESTGTCACTSVERSEEDWLEELNATLDEAIRLHVRSDVPFGAFLSGGMDSSIVTALMARQLDQPVRSFAIGFAEEAHSELPYAAAASRAIGSRHAERVVSPDLAEATFVTLARHFGEPFADSSAVPTFYVSEVAASEVKMVLSGDGGDELFAGYNSYQHTYRQQEASGVKASATSLVAAVGQMLTRRRRRAPTADRELAPFQSDHDRQREIFPAAELDGLLRPIGGAAPAVSFEVAPGSRFEDPLTRFQAQDFKTYMVDDVLTKVDRMSMANSLEVRVPLLDHKVIELAFALPTRLKIRPSPDGSRLDTKWLLRQSSRRFYTEEFLARPKQGFGIPVVEWCQGPLRPLIERNLRERNNPVYDWIDRTYVDATLDEFFGGRDVLVARVWALMMFDLWWRHVHGAA